MGKMEFAVYFINDLCAEGSASDRSLEMAECYSRLSGYLRKTRKAEEELDEEEEEGVEKFLPYEGVAAVVLTSLRKPELITLNEAELEEGLAQHFFPESRSASPAVRVSHYQDASISDLFASYLILEVGKVRILVIGLILQKKMDYEQDLSALNSTFNLEDAAGLVGTICESQKNAGIELTLLFTTGEMEENIKLVEFLPEGTGVDTIIGCGSGGEIQLEDIDFVRNILIYATNQRVAIWHLVVEVDMETHAIGDIAEGSILMEDWLCPRDPVMDELFSKYQENQA